MNYDHLKANADKSKQRVYNKLSEAHVKFINAPETKGNKLSYNKLSKLAGVDRSWAKKEYYALIKCEVDAYNEYVTRPKVVKTAKDVQTNKFERLNNEIEVLKADNIKLLQLNALYKIEADYFQQETESKTAKIKKLQERIANLTKQLNARTRNPIELDDFRK
ncbi:hypothetical protein [Maridesulfovibrio frigidus]|uniref:hypothetical protein n=1 Tax=Maridesulfovibrio frigidus TaxID=340956 RepID=UPI0004E130FA|nr:hypothetical protein [Maridesulfovibrio frigidus]